MATIAVRDANGALIHMKVTGVGDETTPFKPIHDVFIQDQTTRDISLFLAEQLDSGLTLRSNATLDDVLSLTLEDLLERRLQTVVVNKGLAATLDQARQFITHGHIAIAGVRVTSPSHIVLRKEEDEIQFSPNSPLSNQNHPAHQVRSSEEM